MESPLLAPVCKDSVIGPMQELSDSIQVQNRSQANPPNMFATSLLNSWENFREWYQDRLKGEVDRLFPEAHTGPA